MQTLKNKTFKEIDRVGKYLIFKLEDVAFISHLRMEGKYQICKKGDILSKHDHVIFVLDEGMELRYNDVRKFGRMKLVDHDDYKNQLPLSKLGPEPFEIDYLELYQKLKKKNKAIKTVLLDQSIMTGIGNIYANEICYQMHLNPYTKANVLSKNRVKELVDVACEILNKAILQGGTTIHSFSANGIDGLFQVQLKVHMSKGKTMKVYGITGSIACGKSTVTHYLIERGYLVVDADLISRNALTIDQECILKVQELFGCVKDGIVDRKALGRIVFHDKNAKKQLEAIIHPYVILKMKEEIEKNKERDCIFLDIPLLYESHLEYLCDEIIVVYLDEQRQVQRLMARDHIDESYAYTIINNQISSLKKREMADIVFDNNQGIEELYKQIDEFIERISHEEIINE